MLESLHIHDLALIDSAQLDFGSGLIALTGESGSGKSILLDALALVIGCARPRIKPRHGCASGFVEAEFRPARDAEGAPSSSDLRTALSEHGLLEACSGPGEPIILARRVDASGRSRCFIQGQTVTRSVLAEVGRALLELCGQSEAHSLRTPAAQLAALDRFAQLGSKKRKLESLVQALKRSEVDESQLAEQCAEAERRRDFVEFQLRELDEVELAALPERKQRLEELSSAMASWAIHQELFGDLRASEQAIVPRLKWLSARLGSRLRADPGGLISSAMVELDRVAQELDRVAATSSEFLGDSDRLREEASELEAQFSVLSNLARKHRISVDELPSRRAELEEELALCAQLDKDLEAARAVSSAARAAAERAAEQLHAARERAARVVDDKMRRELGRVGLADAYFETRITRVDLAASGISQVEFWFSANPGHPPEPLSRVASGGELGRVLLCFRLATESTGAMLVFDEIDAGAGGKIAEKIAASLRRAASTAQVLCVTHWPQVAGAADQQFAVSKRVVGGVTRSEVQAVGGEDRVQELSRMLGGAERTARQHACGLVKRPATAA